MSKKREAVHLTRSGLRVCARGHALVIGHYVLLCGAGCCLWLRWCSGRRMARPWVRAACVPTGVPGAGGLWRAGLLCAPVGGGPPASRPRREPLARRVVSKPGQAPPPPTGAAAWPSGPSGALQTGGGGGFALHDAFQGHVTGVSDPHVVQLPPIGGSPSVVVGGAVPKVQTTSSK